MLNVVWTEDALTEFSEFEKHSLRDVHRPTVRINNTICNCKLLDEVHEGDQGPKCVPNTVSLHMFYNTASEWQLKAAIAIWVLVWRS